MVRIPGLLALGLLLSGCATITSNEMQPVNLTTRAANGESVDKVTCSLRNDKGAWEAESPALVKVRRSAEDLLVQCKKNGHRDGTLRAISRAAASMFGNILFGGGIGAIVDHSKGTGYNYPDNLPIIMGDSVVVDRKHEQPPSPAQGDPAKVKASTSD